MPKHFLQGIDTIILRVSDIQKAKEWYTETIGFKNIYEDEKINLVILDTFSTTSLTIWETDEKIIIHPKTTPYPIFRTENATVAHQLLIERGVSVGDIITDHGVTCFTFQDPDGNQLEVCETH